MKKIFVLMMGLGFSMGAMATGGALQTDGITDIGVTNSTNTVDINCQALNEDVTINSSANVLGHVNCPNAYTVAIATCHQAGRLDADGTNAYIYYGTSEGGSIAASTTSGLCDATNVSTVSGSGI